MEKTEEGGHHPRTDVKPLHVVQPEGVSFKMDGHVLEWQNWKMHIGELHSGLIHYTCLTSPAYLQRSHTGKALRFPRSRITTMARSGPSSIGSLSPRWSFRTVLLNPRIPGNSPLIRTSHISMTSCSHNLISIMQGRIWNGHDG